MSGATLQQIADRLGYNSRQAVWKATTSLLERQEREATAEWRAFHLARLERLLLGQWQDAINGNTKATDVCLKILQEIGRINGVGPRFAIAASGGVVASVESVSPGLQWASDDEWMRRYVVAWEEVLASRPDGPLVEDDS